MRTAVIVYAAGGGWYVRWREGERSCSAPLLVLGTQLRATQEPDTARAAAAAQLDVDVLTVDAADGPPVPQRRTRA